MKKFYSSKTLLKLAGGGGASPTSPPGSISALRPLFDQPVLEAMLP